MPKKTFLLISLFLPLISGTLPGSDDTRTVSAPHSALLDILIADKYALLGEPGISPEAFRVYFVAGLVL